MTFNLGEMVILGEQDRNQLEDDLEQQIGKNAFDAIEVAILAKIAAAELPEPFFAISEMGKKVPYFTADQLRQAYAQGAAAQLAEKPSGWLCQSRQRGNRHCIAMNPQTSDDFTEVTPLYTRKEAK